MICVDLVVMDVDGEQKRCCGGSSEGILGFIDLAADEERV